MIPARSGPEVWDAIDHAAVELVLHDIMLPGMSGLDLCRALRERSKIPMIVQSSRGSETDRVPGPDLGVDDYIVKPWSNRTTGPLTRKGWVPPTSFVYRNIIISEQKDVKTNDGIYMVMRAISVII